LFLNWDPLDFRRSGRKYSYESQRTCSRFASGIFCPCARLRRGQTQRIRCQPSCRIEQACGFVCIAASLFVGMTDIPRNLLLQARPSGSGADSGLMSGFSSSLGLHWDSYKACAERQRSSTPLCCPHLPPRFGLAILRQSWSYGRGSVGCPLAINLVVPEPWFY